ncbi:MAG: hypothetical protein P8X90_04405 [Desulfobacterales bacterium]
MREKPEVADDVDGIQVGKFNELVQQLIDNRRVSGLQQRFGKIACQRIHARGESGSQDNCNH